jgi:DNA-binding response OmpR family regulator
MMAGQPKVIALDVDPDSLVSLRQAFPGWEIESLGGASIGSLTRDWDPGAADLLVLGVRDQVAETLELCRALRSQAGRADTPLLVLVPPAQQGLVRAALEAGADSCLLLPVHPKELASMVTRAGEGNRPGRHTLALDHAQQQDAWREEGGEA